LEQRQGYMPEVGRDVLLAFFIGVY